MDVRRKILLIVTASIVVTSVPGAVAIYEYAVGRIIEKDAQTMATEAARLIAPAQHRFAEAGEKLPALARILRAELERPTSPEDDRRDAAELERQMVRDASGVWRNRKPPFDGHVEAGLFLPDPAPGTDEALRRRARHWRVKRVLDVFGAAASRPLENTWFLSRDRSEVIFDAALPDFALAMPADNDYTRTPWVSLASPEVNPRRELRVTPPLYDPVARAWMVSVVYPLDVDGQWVGSLGEDMQLSKVMGALFATTELYDDTQHFLLDRDGHFILAGRWQTELERAPTRFDPTFRAEPALARLLASRPAGDPTVTATDLEVGGEEHIAIGARIEPLGWSYFQLTPVDAMLATTRAIFYALAAMIVLMSLASGVVIELGVSRSVVRRLRRLSEAMRRYGRGEDPLGVDLLAGRDEIARAAAAFNDMRADIDRSSRERAAAEQALRESEARWKFALEGAGDGVWDWSIESGHMIVSERWRNLLGYAETERLETFDGWLELLHADDVARLRTALERHLAGGTPLVEEEVRMRCGDGTYRWVVTRGMVVGRDEGGRATRLVGIVYDVTARRNNEEELHLAAMVYDQSSEAMLVADKDNRIIAVNPAFVTMTGYSAEEVIGKTPDILRSGRQDRAFYETMWRSIEATGSWSGEIWNRRKNGDVYAEHLTINTIRDARGAVHRRVALFSDVTERKRTDELIWRQANFDALTGLPNRRMFQDRLAIELRKAHRDGSLVALLFIDLDRFKEVNDSLGHHVGDELLVQAARRLTSVVRESDTVARLGGDEFTVIVGQLHHAHDVDRVVRDLIAALAERYELGAEVARISASIGVTFYPSDGTTVGELLQNADQAMYAAKAEGRNRARFFTTALQEAAIARLRLIAELNEAIAHGELRVLFQPIVDLATGRVTKAEALVRWAHPTRGVVSPAAFIPVAEDTGLVVAIGERVLRESARWARRWHAATAGGFQVSVNRSPVEFRNPLAGAASWSALLAAEGLTGAEIAVEITEGLLLSRDDETVRQLRELRAAGIQLAIDDFGTGYAALAYLKRFAVDFVKIDRSFVSQMVEDPADLALCEAIVVMAHKLGLKVVAEGVETEAQRARLCQIGCDFAQGFLFAEPMSAEALDARLAQPPG